VSRRTEDYESPEEDERIRRVPRPRVAGSVASVVSALDDLRRRTGLVDGMVELAKMNQTDGFDCPGCAWPDPDDERSGVAEYCENGAKAFASEAARGRVDPEFFARYSVDDLLGRSDYWLNEQGRLTHPMIRRPGATHYEPLSWEEALGCVAGELRRLESPDEAAFYTSGRTSNEAAFLYQLFVRMFGTNNMPDCSNMCHESSGTALNEVIGVGKGTVTLRDFEVADTIVVIGQNPGTNHPRMLTTLQAAKRRGCKIIHINPLPEVGLTSFKHPRSLVDLAGRGTRLADVFLPVRVNGDVGLLKGITKAMFEEESRSPGSVFDQQFVRDKTCGFEAFRQDIEREDWSRIQRASGIIRAEIERLVPLLAAPRRTIICWAMGLTQHRNAVANIQSCVNLLLLTGSIGKPGAGACPVRGHSNVQGDRTMGIWDKPSAEFLDALRDSVGFEPPRGHGFDTVETIRAMHDGRVKVFVALGGNFLSATPDTAFTAEALRRCRLTAQVSTTLNRSHLIAGETAVILPCLGRTEVDVQSTGPQFVSVEDSMGVVHASRGTRKPASQHLRSEPSVVAGLASATLGSASGVNWDGLVADYDGIRNLVESVVPGFEDFNRRIRLQGGFVLPNEARDGIFRTATGRAMFSVHPVEENELADGQLTMMTIRSHDQFNTTVYGLDDRYRGLSGRRRVVLMNEQDIAERGLVEGREVDITSHFPDGERVARGFAVATYEIPRGCVATYFPEANVLVPIGHTARGSNTPASKSVTVTIAGR
jgi:molybdopterin-dependent oxidoreductase alpha subunit